MEGGKWSKVMVVVGQRKFKDLDETKRYDTGTLLIALLLSYLCYIS